MKVFLRKILIFSVLIVILQLTLLSILPFYHGSQLMTEKMLEFRRHKQQYNAVIFGSSRMYRHIIPSKLKEALQTLDFYNLAIPGTFNSEQFYLFENFVARLDSGEIKIGVMELSMLDTLMAPNVSSLKGTYSSNINELNYALNYIDNSSWPRNLKESAREKYIESWKNRLLSFRKLRGAFYYLKAMVSSTPERNDGYLPFELDDDKRLIVRRKQFESDTSGLQVQIEASKEAESFKSQNVNEIFYKRAMGVIALAKSKGIHLVFIIPPKLSSLEYQEILPVSNKLPDAHIIEIYQYSKYPYFYESRYSFDFAHLNQNGAQLFSTLLSKEIQKKIFN